MNMFCCQPVADWMGRNDSFYWLVLVLIFKGGRFESPPAISIWFLNETSSNNRGSPYWFISLFSIGLIFSGGSKGSSASNARSCLGANSFIFMQFSAKILQNNKLTHLPHGNVVSATDWFNLTKPGVCLFCCFVCKFLCALIAFLIALQWKCENLLGDKQPKFTKTSTPQLYVMMHETVTVWGCQHSKFHGLSAEAALEVLGSTPTPKVWLVVDMN